LTSLFPAVLILPLAALAASPPAAVNGAAPDGRAREAIVAALAAGQDIPAQAQNLAHLAWPTGRRDEAVAALARRELENFGDHGMNALRESLNTVKLAYTEEVVATTLGAQLQSRVELLYAHMPAMVDALWVGSREAKTLAIGAVAAHPTPFAVGPMIDSAIDDPQLAPIVVDAFGRLRYPQARFYLEKVMMEGPPTLRPLAASSLAQIGGAALGPLKNALKAPSRDARLLAARTLLPAATEYDIGAIYEYVEKHGDDDPELTQALKISTANIEKAIAARDANAAAGSPRDF
jgi:hypothetical protein